jgi:hypothetical protein
VEVLDHREELGVEVVVVAFAIPEWLALYERDMGRPGVRFLSDPDRASYLAFGFPRGSTRRVWLDPRVWWRYAGLIARGRRPQAPREDPLQLGGDVLVDRGGIVRWTYRSAGPEDRPSLDEVRGAVAGL